MYTYICIYIHIPHKHITHNTYIHPPMNFAEIVEDVNISKLMQMGLVAPTRTKFVAIIGATPILIK